MNLFTMAIRQLEKEGKIDPKGITIIDKMVMIRKFMDTKQHLTKMILENKPFKNLQQKHYYRKNHPELFKKY